MDSLLEEEVQARIDESDDEGNWREVVDAKDLAEEADELIPESHDAELLDPMMVYYQHKSSGTLHMLKDQDQFCCGRPVNINYEEAEGEDKIHWHVCNQCSFAVYGSV